MTTYFSNIITYDGLSEGPKFMVPEHLKRFGLSGSLIFVSKLKNVRTSMLKKLNVNFTKYYVLNNEYELLIRYNVTAPK